MITFVINQDIDTTYFMSGDGNRFILNAGVTASTDESTVLRGDATSNYLDLEINGTVRSTGVNSFAAVFMHGEGCSVEVAEGGLLTSTSVGVKFYDYGTLRNAGTIKGADLGVEMWGGDHTLINTGLISSKSGVAVEFGTDSDDVVNQGRIKGDVDLGGGDDTFDFRGGVVDGRVFGGEGDDIFAVGLNKVAMSEAIAGGFDKVLSDGNFKLGKNFEALELRGSGDTNGIGNAENNVMLGNGGRNQLMGRGGEDVLEGGRDNDILIGGANADVFVFGHDTGRDVVKDFLLGTADHDVIDLSAVYTGDLDFSEIADHLSQHGSDVWVDFVGEGRLVLEDVKLNRLTVDHFSNFD
jgi:Ca2+-binding RTX toxin-like protein